MRTLVVGDIHAGLKGLRQVLEKVKPAEADTFIFLGDYVDGWSEAAQTVSFLMEFATQYSCIFLRGNHDELTYEFLTDGPGNKTWLAHGGAATFESYKQLDQQQTSKHLAFYENLHNFYIDDKNRLYLHAGFTNQHGPQYEHYPNLVYWDRTLWEMVCSMDPAVTPQSTKYPKRLRLFDEIYIGHTPVTRIGYTQPVNYANVWNIDTGAAFKGPLSIIDADTKEVWQSDPVWTLYPDEKGRN